MNSNFGPERFKTKSDFGTWFLHWKGNGIQRRSMIQIAAAAAAVVQEVWTCSMSPCRPFWICCVLFPSSIFCELPPHTVALKPTKHAHLGLWLASVWSFSGRAAVVERLARAVSRPTPARRMCWRPRLHLFATGALFVQGGRRGRGNNVCWLRAGEAGGGSWCRQLAPPPHPGSVRLRSFDLEWPVCVYIFPKCRWSSSCLCLSWPAVVPVSLLSCSLHLSSCLARLEAEPTVGSASIRVSFCSLTPPLLRRFKETLACLLAWSSDSSHARRKTKCRMLQKQRCKNRSIKKKKCSNISHGG